MSTEENKAIVRRYIEEVWNKGNLELIDELVAQEYNEFDPDPERSGPERERQTYSFVHTTLPPWNVKIEDIIAEGDRVVVHLTASGTHEGEFRGVAPTGKPFTVRGFNIWRISGGKVVGRRSVLDMLGLFEQVGAFP